MAFTSVVSTALDSTKLIEQPFAICPSTNRQSFFIADIWRHSIHRFIPASTHLKRLNESLKSILMSAETGGWLPVAPLILVVGEYAGGESEVIDIAGSKKGFGNGAALSVALFRSPRALCANPTNPECFWVGDETSIRYYDGSNIHSVAGRDTAGDEDGVGEAAGLDSIRGLVCANEGKALYASDWRNNLIRSVDTKTRVVRTMAGNSHEGTVDGIGKAASFNSPRKMVWYRRPHLTIESILLITSHLSIRRFDVTSGQVTTINLPTIHVNSLVCTAIGLLIICCFMNNSLYVIDPDHAPNPEPRLLAGPGNDSDTGWVDGNALSARFDWPTDITWTENEQSVYVVDCHNRKIRHVTIDPVLLAMRDP